MPTQEACHRWDHAETAAKGNVSPASVTGSLDIEGTRESALTCDRAAGFRRASEPPAIRHRGQLRDKAETVEEVQGLRVRSSRLAATGPLPQGHLCRIRPSKRKYVTQPRALTASPTQMTASRSEPRSPVCNERQKHRFFADRVRQSAAPQSVRQSPGHRALPDGA